MRSIGRAAAMEFRRVVRRRAKAAIGALALLAAALVWVNQVRPLSHRG